MVDVPTRLVVRVLGPCVVTEHEVTKHSAGEDGSTVADATIDPAARAVVELTALQKKIVARLALAKPDPVEPAALIDAVWGSAPPATARTAIQNQISRLRSRLGRDAIATVDGHYVLDLDTDSEIVTRCLHDLTMSDGPIDEPGIGPVEAITRVVGLWRGVPYSDLEDLDDVEHERLRLAEIRRSLETVQLEEAIDADQLAWAVPEAERLVAQTPRDEHRWSLLVRALERSGRRGDALGAFERARRILAITAGLEPSAELREAEAAALAGPGPVGQSRSVQLVGRDRTIGRVLDACTRGSPVVLSGESGAGKSRVLAEVQRRLARTGFRLATHECPSYPATAITTLRDLVDELGIELEVGSPPIRSFVDAVAAARADGPIAIVVDDVDHAGPTTMQALCEVASLDGVAFVAAAGDVASTGLGQCAEVVELEPLDENESMQFARVLLGDTVLSEAQFAWLHTMSGGNPGLLEHLISDLSWLMDATHLNDGCTDDVEVAGGPPNSDSGDSWTGGPPSLLEMVRARLDRLDPVTRATLEIAAVCGARCRTWLLVAFGVEEGISKAIDALLLDVEPMSDVVRRTGGTGDYTSGGWVRFRHGAIRQVLYEDLPAGHRMEIHYRAAELLRASGAPPVMVGAHSLRAYELDPEGACRDAVSAARQSAADGAHADAAQWLQWALDVIEPVAGDVGVAIPIDDRLKVEIMVLAADEMRLAGMTDQEQMQFAAAEAAFELGDGDLIARAAFAALQLGATTESGSAHARATKLAEDALAAVDNPDDRALTAASASLTHSMSGNTDLCSQLFHDAVRWAEKPATRCLVLPSAYMSLGHPDDLDLRESLTRELLDLAVAEDDPVARFEGLQLEYSVGLMRSDGARVRKAIAEASDLIVRVRDIGRMWSLRYQHASLAHIDGDLDVAETLAEEALGLFQDVSPSRAFAAYGGQLLAIRMAQGRLHELVDTIEGLLAEQPGVPAWNAALALALGDRDPGRAGNLARAALDGVEHDFTWLAAHLIGGRAAAVIGDDETCRMYLERLAPWSGLGSWQGTCSYGPVDTVLWMLHRSLGDDRLAARHLEIARRSAESLGSPTFNAELVE